MCVGGTGNAISKLCADQGTKNVLADGSAEPGFGATLGWRKDKRMYHRNETCSEIFKLKNVYICETSELAERQLYAQTERKWLVMRQVVQQANCTPAGQPKLCGWIALLSLL